MFSSVPTICLWIPYVLDSTVPKNATLGGYYNEGDKSNSYHLYIARTTYMGEMVPVRQVHAGHHYAVVFARGTNNFITAVQLGGFRGEILTCKNNIADLRWLKFDPLMDLDSCIPYGKTNTGETGYVGRTFVKSPKDSNIQGSVCGFFVPSDGFITVYLAGLIHSTDVEVLCIK